jgi:Tfp pilus assembly protein PilV
MGLRNIQNKSSRLGFSMVEMLVAMALLVTVISGVVFLYVGAVNTVRQGYKAIDNFEIGRTTLAAIERDLERAFTARQYGQFFQFHGSPNAMMYVGVLENGELGRVTYAVNRLDDNNDFTMQDTQGLRTVLDRAMAYASDATTGFPGSVEAIEFTRILATMFALDGSVISGTLPEADVVRLLPLAFDNAVIEGTNEFNACVNSGDESCEWKLGKLIVEDPLDLGNFVSFEDATLEFEVNVQTAYMLRYEEPGVTNLGSFDLPPNPDNPAVPLVFPTIDPSDPNSIRNNPAFDDYRSLCPVLGGGIESLSNQGQGFLTCYTFSHILMPDPNDLLQIDLRNLATGESSISDGDPASYITPKIIDRIFEAAKRDIWLDLISGGPIAERMLTDVNNIPSPLNYFTAWGLDADTSNDKDPYDYVIAERIVVGGRPVTYNLPVGNTQEEVNFLALYPAFDVLGIGAFFTYADTDGAYLDNYNARENIPGYEAFVDPNALDINGTPITGFDRFTTFDTALGEEMRGTLTVQSQGSPIAPRIPALVSPRFWIMTEGATLNDPPFKRYFDQVVDVPSSTRRTLPKQFVPDAG